VEHAAPRADAALSAKSTLKTGAQQHFYMETQSCMARKVDGNIWELVVSDQDCNFTQGVLSGILGVPAHNIRISVPRAGGGFGGKLTRQTPVAAACAVAANKTGRAVQIQNERSDDLQMVRGREFMDFEYNATFDAQGKVDTMDMTIHFDPGYFYGDAAGDLSMAVSWSDGSYHYNSFKVNQEVHVTNTQHTTSQRAPGNLQSLVAADAIMEHVSRTVGRPLEEVMQLNFYKEGDKTPFGDTIGKDGFNWTVPQLFKQLQESTKYQDRKKAVQEYNAKNRWTKKGIAISTVKYPMGTTFYQSGALICVYGDGSVLVSSGGCELGQGLATKVALVVADTLKCDLKKITVGDRDTAKVPNNTCTGGSGTSECSSEAAILAANKVVEALKPYRDGKTWEETCAAAVAGGAQLMQTAFWQNGGTSNTDVYATYGACTSEVMVDVLTGEVRVDRVDILMDLGTQLDAAVDIGQLQGGFVMAMGYLLTEQVMYDDQGTQLNLGTWEYKIPSAYDIPVEFNVSLLKDSPNPVGVKGSKASAEPAMGLVSAVYLSIKDALYAARQQTGAGAAWFPLNLPVTTEAIRGAVGTLDKALVIPGQ